MSGEPRRPASGSHETARAQTPIDFAVGASVFLLTLAFVVAFIPTLFDPFTGAATASPIASDRVAAGLAGDLLAASPTEPGVLSPACTVAFFEPDAGLADAADCPEGVEDGVAAQFGLDEEVLVAIQPLNESDPTAGASNLSIDTRYGTHALELRRSTTTPVSVDRGGVSASQRVVSIRGDRYRLTVWVW